MNQQELEAIRLGEPVLFEKIKVDRIIIGIYLGWILYEEEKEVLATRDVKKVIRYLRDSQKWERDGEIIPF